MARKVYEGNYLVYWLTSCANIASPTTAEIAAGALMGTFVTKDGVALNMTENGVDTASINDTFDSQIGGSWGTKPSLTLMRDSTTETNGWNLVVKGTQGFLLIAVYGAVTATSKCMVFPAEMGIGQPVNSAKDTVQKFTVNFFVTATPNLKAVIA